MRDYKAEATVARQFEALSMQQAQGGYGIVLHYDPEENAATVLLSRPGSDQPGEIFSSVPCPVTNGVQVVSPEIGRPCWVEFKGNTQTNPMITHFFNHSYHTNDYARQYYADNDTPRFMMEM